jgi:hypothetical protein
MKGTSSLCIVFCVRACPLWYIIGVVEATPEQINLPLLQFHTGGDLPSDVSEFMATCSCRSFISAAWSSLRSLDLARSISRCVIGVRLYPRQPLGPGRVGCSRTWMLIRRWWIYRYSPTMSMGCDGSWSKAARGHPPVDVPQ